MGTPMIGVERLVDWLLEQSCESWRNVRDVFDEWRERVACQQCCHDILAEEVRHISEGLTRGSGNGGRYAPAPPPRRNPYGQNVT